MRWGLYLRNHVVLVPTTGVLEEGPVYRDMEPVDVAPLSNVDTVGRALHSAIARGNPPAPRYSLGNFPPPVVLKYAGVKSWAAFERGTLTWTIEQADTTYQIIGYRRHAKRATGSRTRSRRPNFHRDRRRTM
jgi:hypothetical protein